jgi:hypothetical protein
MYVKKQYVRPIVDALEGWLSDVEAGEIEASFKQHKLIKEFLVDCDESIERYMDESDEPTGDRPSYPFPRD